MADARRNKMTDAYAPVREAAKERQKASPGRPKKGKEQIPEVLDSRGEERPQEKQAPKTRTTSRPEAALTFAAGGKIYLPPRTRARR